MKPRPYQSKALDSIWDSLQYNLNTLLVAACSAGKTLMFSLIAKRLLTENRHYNITILMDREVLVRQTYDKLLAVAPELALNIGIACASVSSNKDHEKPVTVASRQTLSNMLDKCIAPQLLIIDEAHLMSTPKIGKYSPDQYGVIINRFRQGNPNMRLLGVTATPYRLVDGYMYGERNSPNCRPYFDSVCHEITVKELTELGYLAALTGYTAIPADLSNELSRVSITGGEYNTGELSSVMTAGKHITSAVQVWQDHASDRKKTIAFCVTVDHAEKLAEAFNDEGIHATAIHSKLTPLENLSRMEALKNGEYKVFCSVAKLTTGMDVPDIDCIIMARPTKSAALYKQILGRGQRIAPNKNDCLVLDLVGNNRELGTDLDNLNVTYKMRTDVKGNPIAKICPECFKEVHVAIKICIHCGYAFAPPDDTESDTPGMESVDYGTLPPMEWDVESMFVETHTSKSSKKELLKIRLEVYNDNSLNPHKTVYIWMCFEDDGYNGYAVMRGAERWAEMTGENSLPVADRYYPKSAAEAESAKERINKPDRVLVDNSGKYANVIKIIYDSVEVPF